jgi:prepilin-type processing-associated H-X9-DG protein
MKQLGLAMMQYTHDYDECFPVGYGTAADREPIAWAEKLYAYTKSQEVFICPTDAATTAKLNYEPGAQRESYGMNANITNPKGDYYTFKGHLSDLNSSASTVMLFEAALGSAKFSDPYSSGFGSPTCWGDARCAAQYSHGYGWYATGFLGGRGGTTFTNPATYRQSDAGGQAGVPKFDYSVGRHLDGSNFLMVDGHVKWLLGDKVSGGTTPASETAAQTGTTTGNAEGTGYAGTDKHAVTFSQL